MVDGTCGPEPVCAINRFGLPEQPSRTPSFPTQVLAQWPALADLTIGGAPFDADILCLAQHCPNLERFEWYWSAESDFEMSNLHGWHLNVGVLEYLQDSCPRLRALPGTLRVESSGQAAGFVELLRSWPLEKVGLDASWVFEAYVEAASKLQSAPGEFKNGVLSIEGTYNPDYAVKLKDYVLPHSEDFDEVTQPEGDSDEKATYEWVQKGGRVRVQLCQWPSNSQQDQLAI